MVNIRIFLATGKCLCAGGKRSQPGRCRISDGLAPSLGYAWGAPQTYPFRRHLEILNKRREATTFHLSDNRPP